MDALTSLQGLVKEGSMEVHVGGRPLSNVVSEIVLALNEQRDALAQLRDYTYQTNQQQWDRITALETRVARLDADVNIESRPMDAAAGGHVSMDAAIRSLEARGNGLEAKRRGNAALAVQKESHAMLMREKFQKWVRRVRVTRAVRHMVRDTEVGLRRLFFQRWDRALRRLREIKAQLRKVKSLVELNSHRGQLRYFVKWAAFAEQCREDRKVNAVAKRKAVASMATVTSRGHARARFLCWVDFAEGCRERREQCRIVGEMEVLSHRFLVGRYLRHWRVVEEHYRKRRHQNRIANALVVSSATGLCRRSFVRWLARVRRHRDRLKASALIPRLHHGSCLRLAAAYYGKLRRHVANKQQRRERAAFDANINELAARCERQEAQLDVSVRAMANANSVLGQLVDRVLAVEHKAGITHGGAYGVAEE